MGGNTNFLFILIIPLILILGFFWWKKKKKQQGEESMSYGKRRADDEVWQTVKEHIRKTDGKGKEIVDSFVAKVPPYDYIDKKLPKEEQLKKKEEIKKIKLAEKKRKEECKKNKKKYIPLGSRSLYVVTFITRNAKNKVEDKPRAIECEVIQKRIDKKTSKREIIVTRELNYKKEAEWIMPLKKAEEEKFQKEYESKLRAMARKKEKEEKKKARKAAKQPKKESLIITDEPSTINETVILTPKKETKTSSKRNTKKGTSSKKSSTNSSSTKKSSNKSTTSKKQSKSKK